MRLIPVRSFSESGFGFDTAETALIGIPLDSTVSFRPGARFAPSSIRECSWHMEDYDFRSGKNILDVPFHDVGDIHLSGGTARSLKTIESAVSGLLKKGKKPVSIGGEHLISYPVVKALKERHGDLHVIIFDAHTDLSDRWRALRLSHANVTRLIYEELGTGRVHLFGTRAGTQEDKRFMKGKISFSYEGPSEGFLKKLKGKPVYVSIDADVLDPSVAPGVTTPEMGGWGYEEMRKALLNLRVLKNIVGADVVEICPAFDPSGITSIAGANLVREMLFLINAGE